MRYISSGLLLIVLLSCGGNKILLETVQISDQARYELNSYVGCCGCKANYFDLKLGNKILEEVIYSYNCSGPGIPTKFRFNYSENGKIVDFSKYIATTESDYEIQLTSSEKSLFAAIERDSTLKGKDISLSLSRIQGFRKLFAGEMGHSFPLIKKGYKLQSR
jgi:hypothetical protein